MKTIPVILFFAALCVFAFGTVAKFEVIVSVTFVTALVAVLQSDYGREKKPATKAPASPLTSVPHHP